MKKFSRNNSHGSLSESALMQLLKTDSDRVHPSGRLKADTLAMLDSADESLSKPVYEKRSPRRVLLTAVLVLLS